MDNMLPLWSEDIAFPPRDAMAFPQGAVDIMVHRAGSDEYGFLHDAAIVSHRGALFAAWYNCPDKEIEGRSLIRGRRSSDGGRTWSDPYIIASDHEHRGVFYVPVTFLSFQNELYAFVCNMVGHDLVTCCEVFMPSSHGDGQWVSGGFITGPFLPNCAPLRLVNGDFLMAGRMAERPGAKPTIPAVAISNGDRVTSPWTVVPILSPGKCGPEIDLPYPETTVLADGGELTAIIRNDHGNALVCVSGDCGNTWAGPFQQNLPIGASKIYAGILSTGQRYLVCNTPTQAYRDLLVLAASAPGQ